MIDKLVYCFEFLNDIYDASEGSCMPEITADELKAVNDLLKQTIVEPSKKAPVSFSVLTEMLKLMSEQATNTDEPSASAPNIICEYTYAIVGGLTEDEKLADKISDDVFELASDLVEAIGKYR